MSALALSSASCGRDSPLQHFPISSLKAEQQKQRAHTCRCTVNSWVWRKDSSESRRVKRINFYSCVPGPGVRPKTIIDLDSSREVQEDGGSSIFLQGFAASTFSLQLFSTFSTPAYINVMAAKFSLLLKQMLQHIRVSVIIFKTAWWIFSLVYSKSSKINVITLQNLFPTSRSCKFFLCIVHMFNLSENEKKKKDVSLIVVVLPWLWRSRRLGKTFQRSHAPVSVSHRILLLLAGDLL